VPLENVLQLYTQLFDMPTYFHVLILVLNHSLLRVLYALEG